MKVLLNAKPADYWISEVPRLSRQLEERLYRSAESFEEYADPTTLKSRIQQIARAVCKQQDRPNADSAKDKDETTTQAHVTVLPKVICTPAEASAVLNQKHMENLFVDLMFFLSHGLTQPPSCKKCALRNTQTLIGETNEDDISLAVASGIKCHRLVLWRKDANLAIEASNMQTNIVVLECHSVGHLLIGEPVGTWIWNGKGNFLVDFACEKILGSTPFERTHGLAMLLHASKCETDPGMCTENCQKMQTLLHHFRSCQPLLNGSGCDLCGCIKPLLRAHSEICTVKNACPIPACADLKADEATKMEGISRITGLG